MVAAFFIMTIRPGKKEDLQQVLELIIELAIYEKAEDQVEATVAQMEKDCFENNIFDFIVAVNDQNKLVGTAIYYYRYSTWKGKRMYLEDLVVTESERGKGIGKLLFDGIIKKGKEENCTGMMWQVLEWNKDAINFYKKYYNAELDGEWFNCSIDLQQNKNLS